MPGMAYKNRVENALSEAYYLETRARMSVRLFLYANEGVFDSFRILNPLNGGAVLSVEISGISFELVVP